MKTAICALILLATIYLHCTQLKVYYEKEFIVPDPDPGPVWLVHDSTATKIKASKSTGKAMGKREK